MNRLQKTGSALVAAVTLMTLPAQTLAFGWGFGFGHRQDTTMQVSQGTDDVSVDTSTDARIDGGPGRGFGNRSFMHGRKDRGNRPDDDQNSSEGSKNSDAKNVRQGIMSLVRQLNEAFHAVAKPLLDTCKSKTTDDERKACVESTKVTLQAKVTAAIQALKQ